MHYTYVLVSLRDHNLYIGYSTDLKKRVEDHNTGKNISTSKRMPFKLLYYEAYVDKKDALARESFLKSGRGHEVLYKQLRNTLSEYKTCQG